MASSTATATATATTAAAAAGPAAHDEDDHDPPSRKRRRSREPDWNTFYRNGLPKEIIVIDDTPEPEANTGRKLTTTNTNGDASNIAVAGTAVAATSYETSTTNPRQPVKRRRRDAPSSGYHVQYVGSRTNTPLQHGTPIGSTLSSDRTNSLLTTTAPTSLSSNSQYDEPPAPLKRKRTTRQQAANEAKRRDVDGLGGRLLTYKPPPFPPKKVSDVQVRVVHDVSTVSSLPFLLLLTLLVFRPWFPFLYTRDRNLRCRYQWR
jgi:dual-specificity kinase